MLFRKRKRVPVGLGRGGAISSGQPPECYTISFESMLKGAILTRNKKPIRQVAVMVNCAPRLVTSGDVVDQRTYDALLQYGVIAPRVELSAGETPPTGAA